VTRGVSSVGSAKAKLGKTTVVAMPPATVFAAFVNASLLDTCEEKDSAPCSATAAKHTVDKIVLVIIWLFVSAKVFVGG